MLKSYSVSVIILLCVAMVETAILSNISFLPAVPDLLLICSIYLSLSNGRGFGEACGFSSGLFIDCLSGCPFGLNCLLRTIVGYIAGFFGQTINREGIVMPCFIMFLGTLLKVFVTWFISLFFPSSVSSYSLASVEFIFELVCNIILAPLMFKFLDCFQRMIRLMPEED